MVAAIYLLLLITPAFSASVSYRECSSQGSLAVINKVEMTPCTQAPCPLSAGKSFTVKITFTPSENLKNPFVVGFIVQNKPSKIFHEQLACDDLVNLNTGNKLKSEDCTLKANNKYQFTAKKVIKSVSEEMKGQYEMIWGMAYPKRDEDMFCASVGVAIA
ncbi:Uncharacterised protein g6821 [Pycnogonum litorale]